jgi:hypothetical protein
MNSAQPLFAGATPAGQPVVFIVGDKGTCVVKIAGEVRHESEGMSPDAIDAALAVFRRAVNPRPARAPPAPPVTGRGGGSRRGGGR